MLSSTKMKSHQTSFSFTSKADEDVLHGTMRHYLKVLKAEVKVSDFSTKIQAKLGRDIEVNL